MKRFLKLFPRRKCNIIGMIHVNPLPGTPKYIDGHSWNVTLEKAKHEANIYVKYGLDSVLIENMHDVPYVKERFLGPEIIASMTRVSSDVRGMLPQNMPCGIQVLAFGNRQALAVAKASDLQYIRAEAFIFAHIADEGYADACAGDLLRYRKHIDAENVLVLTDLKKKHSSHVITQDISLLETAKAADFFLTDGIIVTGSATGQPAALDDINELAGNIQSPLLIGSGVTKDNIEEYYDHSNGVIIGSHFKVDGKWENDLCERRIDEFMRKIDDLEKRTKSVLI